MITSGVHVALLRGINVGGKNKLPMKDLAAVFTELGCVDVRTYIQSGNVVLRAKPAVMKALAARAAAAILERHALKVPVVLRTAEEIAAAAREHALAASGLEALHVAFLADEPSAAQIAALDPQRSPPDAFLVRGREVYLYLPNGARSKITNAYLDSKLTTVSTWRNWRTVLALLEMTRGSS